MLFLGHSILYKEYYLTRFNYQKNIIHMESTLRPYYGLASRQAFGASVSKFEA